MSITITIIPILLVSLLTAGLQESFQAMQHLGPAASERILLELEAKKLPGNLGTILEFYGHFTGSMQGPFRGCPKS